MFREISELFILVPALMGLKGNLDMTLASRLSTQANLGNMTSAKKIVHMVVGNIALVQVQATVASFIVALFAFGVGLAFDGLFNLDHAFLLVASSMFTATTSCFVLGENFDIKSIRQEGDQDERVMTLSISFLFKTWFE